MFCYKLWYTFSFCSDMFMTICASMWTISYDYIALWLNKTCAWYELYLVLTSIGKVPLNSAQQSKDIISQEWVNPIRAVKKHTTKTARGSGLQAILILLRTIFNLWSTLAAFNMWGVITVLYDKCNKILLNLIKFVYSFLILIWKISIKLFRVS